MKFAQFKYCVDACYSGNCSRSAIRSTSSLSHGIEHKLVQLMFTTTRQTPTKNFNGVCDASKSYNADGVAISKLLKMPVHKTA